MAKGRGSDSNPGWPHSAIEMSKVVMPFRKKSILLSGINQLYICKYLN